MVEKEPENRKGEEEVEEQKCVRIGGQKKTEEVKQKIETV